MNDLKPCPFCGEDAAHLETSYFRENLIYCENCDMYFTLDAFSATKKDIVNAWNRRAEPEERNNPLTWDELKQMEGKPVWVEDAFENGEWYIIERVTWSGLMITHDRWGDESEFKVKDIGDVWQAYRKERG